jgi:hypothetical protein
VPPDNSISFKYRGKDIGALKKLEKFNILMKVTELAERAGKDDSGTDKFFDILE